MTCLSIAAKTLKDGFARPMTMRSTMQIGFTRPEGCQSSLCNVSASESMEILGTRITPIPLEHGRYSSLGFRFGNMAYCTDTNGIPEASRSLLQGLDVLILDGLRHNPHPTHFSLEEAVETARQLRPRRTLFTHIAHDLEHEATNAMLPPGMELAYDGLVMPLASL